MAHGFGKQLGKAAGILGTGLVDEAKRKQFEAGREQQFQRSLQKDSLKFLGDIISSDNTTAQAKQDAANKLQDMFGLEGLDNIIQPPAPDEEEAAAHRFTIPGGASPFIQNIRVAANALGKFTPEEQQFAAQKLQADLEKTQRLGAGAGAGAQRQSGTQKFLLEMNKGVTDVLNPRDPISTLLRQRLAPGDERKFKELQVRIGQAIVDEIAGKPIDFNELVGIQKEAENLPFMLDFSGNVAPPGSLPAAVGQADTTPAAQGQAANIEAARKFAETQIAKLGKTFEEMNDNDLLRLDKLLREQFNLTVEQVF